MRRLAIVTIWLLAAAAAGCTPPGRTVSLSIWQEGIAEYVREEGNGDPNVLRNVTLASAHPGFAMLGNDRIDLSTDASGVLLGRRQIGSKAYFIYLVGISDGGDLKELRLAALYADGVRLNWTLGNPNAQALQAYQQYHAATWKRAYPKAEKPPAIYRNFPLAEDRFQLAVEGQRVIATHEQSGARWEMILGS